jgi:hypothetical protein
MNSRAIPGAYLFRLYVCDKEMSWPHHIGEIHQPDWVVYVRDSEKFRLTNVIPERIIFVSRGITVISLFVATLHIWRLAAAWHRPCCGDEWIAVTWDSPYWMDVVAVHIAMFSPLPLFVSYIVTGIKICTCVKNVTPLTDKKRTDQLFMSRILTIQVYHDKMRVILDECFLTFHRIIVPSAAVQEDISSWTAWPWEWGCFDPLKCCELHTEQFSVTSWKTWICRRNATVRTSTLTASG